MPGTGQTMVGWGIPRVVQGRMYTRVYIPTRVHSGHTLPTTGVHSGHTLLPPVYNGHRLPNPRVYNGHRFPNPRVYGRVHLSYHRVYKGCTSHTTWCTTGTPGILVEG